jgi:fructokinase
MGKARLGPAGHARKPRLVSWGELLWDIFPDKGLLGGSAANVAYHAALVGAESSLISAVGDDSLGRRATRQLAQHGVNVSGVTVAERCATGKVRVTFESGQPHFSIEEGVAWDQINPTEETLAALKSADVFCYSTLAQRTPLMRTRLRRVLQNLKKQSHAPLCILDLNLRPPFTQYETIREALRYADIVKLNEAEEAWIRELAGTRDAVTWLLSDFSISVVALTRAERGASLFTRHVRVHEKGITQSGGDAVGAGDAFVAALGVALATGESLPRALERANRHAAWVAGQHGAMPESPLIRS